MCSCCTVNKELWKSFQTFFQHQRTTFGLLNNPAWKESMFREICRRMRLHNFFYEYVRLHGGGRIWVRWKSYSIESLIPTDCHCVVFYVMIKFGIAWKWYVDAAQKLVAMPTLLCSAQIVPVHFVQERCLRWSNNGCDKMPRCKPYLAFACSGS